MNIIVYTKTGCPWCIGATTFMHDHDIAFEERDVIQNPEYMQEMIDKSDQTKAPTFDIDGEILPDYSAEELETYLKGKGLL